MKWTRWHIRTKDEAKPFWKDRKWNKDGRKGTHGKKQAKATDRVKGGKKSMKIQENQGKSSKKSIKAGKIGKNKAKVGKIWKGRESREQLSNISNTK